MGRRNVPALLFAVIAATSAVASTDAAWQASTQRARAACSAAAGLRHPRVSAPLLFSDAVGRDALLVQGTYRQPFMKGARGTMLCLFDRRSGKAEVSEAKGWSAP